MARVPDENRWVVTVQAPSEPSQVIVDPDHGLLDAVPDNNRWKPEIAWRFTPFMTPLDESSQFQSYDRTSIVAGPFIDQYARGGFKIGACARQPLAGDRLGRDRTRAPRGHFRRSVRPRAIPLALLVAGSVLRRRALQLLQRQAPLRRPCLPAVSVPRNLQLLDRRPRVCRALLRHRQRVLGG